MLKLFRGLRNIFIFILNLLFIFMIIMNNILPFSLEGWVLRILFLYLLFTINFLYSLINKIKTKSDFNYFDILYRINKK